MFYHYRITRSYTVPFRGLDKGILAAPLGFSMFVLGAVRRIDLGVHLNEYIQLGQVTCFFKIDMTRSW